MCSPVKREISEVADVGVLREQARQTLRDVLRVRVRHEPPTAIGGVVHGFHRCGSLGNVAANDRPVALGEPKQMGALNHFRRVGSVTHAGFIPSSSPLSRERNSARADQRSDAHAVESSTDLS